MSESPKIFPHPYDPDLALRLTNFMIDNKSAIISPPDSIANAEITTEAFTHSDTESNFAVSGLFRLFKSAGSAEGLASIDERLLHRNDVVSVAGEIIKNVPGEKDEDSGYDPNPIRDKMGVKSLKGVHGREIVEKVDDERNPDDFTKLGDQLFRKKLEISRPNPYRPVSRSEVSAVKKLNNLEEKRIAARSRADWLRKSQSSTGKHRLTLSETLNSINIERRVTKLDKKAARLANKFEETKNSRDISGRIVHKSVNKIVNKLIRK